MSTSSAFHRIGRALRAALSLAFGVSLVGALGAVRPDLMLVERVVFEGNAQATDASLRHLADLPNGTRVWEVDTLRVARAVERHPWVRRASVARGFDGVVRVEIEEHRPVALLNFDGLYYVADDGTAFMRANGRDLDHPVITGISVDLEARHPELPRRAVLEALALIDALDARGLVTRDQVHEVAFSPTHGFAVRAGRARLLFSFRDDEMQLDRLATLLAQGRIHLDQPLHVDLGPETVAIVRPLRGRSDG